MKFYVEFMERENVTPKTPDRFAASAHLVHDDNCYGGFYIDYGSSKDEAFANVSKAIYEDYGTTTAIVVGELPECVKFE